MGMRMVWNEPLVQKPEPTQGLAALLQKPDSGMTAAEMAKVVNSAPESLLLEVAKQMADEEDATRKREESAGSKLESAREGKDLGRERTRRCHRSTIARYGACCN